MTGLEPATSGVTGRQVLSKTQRLVSISQHSDTRPNPVEVETGLVGSASGYIPSHAHEPVNRSRRAFPSYRNVPPGAKPRSMALVLKQVFDLTAIEATRQSRRPSMKNAALVRKTGSGVGAPAQMSTNPMRSAHAAPRCCARSKRSGVQCRGPAVRGKRVCRMHGARAGAPRGVGHGRFSHGARTIQAREEMEMLRALLKWVRGIEGLD